MKKFFFGLFLCLLSVWAVAQTTTTTNYYLDTLDSTETYIRSSVPNHAFGMDASANHTLVTGGWGDTYVTFIKYDLSKLPKLAKGDQISIWFYNRTVGGTAQPGDINMGLLTSSFNMSATWNNTPWSWKSDTVRHINVSPYEKWTEIDLTDYHLNHWQNGVTNDGIALAPINPWNNFNFFQSSRNTPGQKPYLKVTRVNQNGFMKFPLNCAVPLIKGSCPVESTYSHGAYTPQMMISALDHSAIISYQKDGRIVTFTGEQFANTADYPKNAQISCYPKIAGAAWSTVLQSLYMGNSPWDKKLEKNLNCCTNKAVNHDGHPGYDYIAWSGTPIYAVASGKVVKSQNGICIPKGLQEGCSVWGALAIDHGNGYISQYLHLNKINVEAGQLISKGQKIGEAGMKAPTNKSINSHLHFEVFKLKPGYGNDYHPGSYATVDPYGFNAISGVQDILANSSGVPSVCLWEAGCTNP